jgi:Transcription factor WhiB
MTTSETMARELLEMTSHHQVPPCGHNSQAWTSEHRAQRQWAARHCADCQLLDLCADLGNEIHARFGVWGGRDRTPKTRNTKRKAHPAILDNPQAPHE